MRRPLLLGSIAMLLVIAGACSSSSNAGDDASIGGPDASIGADGPTSSDAGDAAIDGATSATLPNDVLVFDSNRTGNYEIFRMNVDGTNAAPLTTDTTMNSFWPRTSSDRAHILFYRVPLLRFGPRRFPEDRALGDERRRHKCASTSRGWNRRLGDPSARRVVARW